MSHTSFADVAVIGAGPYGLSVAAHLDAADGLGIRVFGQPMSFWEEQMPVGMLLRSPWGASNLSDPGAELTLNDYESASGEVPKPMPLERFVDYGRWFERETAPTLDRRRVELVENGNGFRLELEDGEVVRARRLVVAAGIAPFAWTPPEFASLPPELCSHTSVHRDLSAFAGREVAVIGGGQSAIESSALLHEAGASVDVFVRAAHINWLVRSGKLHKVQAIRKLLYHPADIGPAGMSWVVATPRLFKLLPLRYQDPAAKRAIRPAASGWLVPRTQDVSIHYRRTVASAEAAGEKARLVLDDGSVRDFDHILLGTGYRIDVSRFPFLPPSLTGRLSLVNGLPRLTRGFESSVPGLYFAGAPAAYSFGPLMRFVAGTGYAARALTRDVLAASKRR